RVASVKPYVREFLGSDLVVLMHGMLLIGFLVLLVACANVANLTLAQASRRMREMSIRTALGATRRRLTGQMLVETSVIAVGGGLLGLVFAWWMMRSLEIYMEGT